MENIEIFRSNLDKLYNARLFRLIGALITCYASRVLLTTSLFQPLTVWVFAVAVGALFFFKPRIAVLLNAVAIFFSLAHINGVAAIIVLVLSLLFANGMYFSAFIAIVMPVTFLNGNIFSGWQFLLLLFGFCVAAKSESMVRNVIIGIYYSMLALMTMKIGFPNFYYDSEFAPVKPQTETISGYLDSLNFESQWNHFISSNITMLVIVVAIYALLGVLAYYLFIKVKIGGKSLAFDVSEGISFIIMIIATIMVTFAGIKLFATETVIPFASIILQGILAYIISRPFASDVAMRSMSVLAKGNDALSDGVVSAAELTFNKWDSIAGYEETKKEIQEAIKPYTDKNEYEKLIKAGMKPVKGMLLFGPPGTGKTTMARIVANDTRMKLIVVNASSFLSKYVGDSEKNLVNVFKEAKRKAPCIICFDEIESFLMDRASAERRYEASIVSTFLTQMDGYNELKDVFVIATTNNPTMIDPAALRPGRFDKLIFVGAPDIKAREAIFKRYLKDKVLPDIDYFKLAERSERFTGADIKALCETAYRENDYKSLNLDQLLMRLSTTYPSYTLEMRKMYDLWSKKYGRSSIAQEDNQVKSVKKLSWSDIKGMDNIKSVLKDKIELPIQNADKYKKYGIPASKGILFFGPPGCGKTFFAKVVADECNANFFTINGPELLGRGIGESEENLRKVFENARELKPSILFFDEIDAIAESRENGNGSVRLINQLLTEMDGMEALSGVTVIAATNRPDKLDSALMRAGRFDTKIYIPMPDVDSIRQQLESTIGSVPCEADCNEIAGMLVGYTCADVVAIANKAKAQFVKRSITGNETPLTMDDFKLIISSVQSSVSSAEAEMYEKQRVMESLL